MGEMRNVFKILVRNHEWKRPIGRLNCRWEESNIMNLMEIGWESVD
jgi:hypothetical protein